MIAFDSDTKQAYKDYDREIKVMGNLYLAKRRLSKNLLDESSYINLNNATYSNGIFTQTTADTNNNPNVQLQAYNNGVYVYQIGSISLTDEGNIKYFHFAKTSEFNQLRYKINGSVIDTAVMFDVSNLQNDVNYYIGTTYINKTQGSIAWEKMYINTENTYEEYGVMVSDYGSNNPTSVNLFNKDSITTKEYILKRDGTIHYSGSLNDGHSDYIVVDGLEKIILSGNNLNYNNGGAFYNSSKEYISGFSSAEIEEGISVPNNAYYVIVNVLPRDINTTQLQSGDVATPYERYNSTPFKLTEENECKILGFNINEKTDIYYTSLPYNTMEIEVDNEKGYFTDYDPDSIVNKLNQDCYVDLFVNNNDGDYYKIMTMKFDKISSSDYEKAKLSFKSNISLLENLTLRDKNKLFTTTSSIYKNDLIKYYKDNYNLNLVCDNTTNDLMYRCGYTTDMTPQRMLLHAGTRYNTLEKAVLTINDSQDNIVQRTWKSSPQDTILLNYQQEKPIVKREDVYRGVQRKYISNGNWENSTETFNYVLSGKLTSKNECIVLFNDQYKIKDITISDITVSGNVSVNVYSTTMNEALEVFISGNIGDEYTISMSKQNIVRKVKDNYIEEAIGSTEDTTKVLKITETAPLQSGYYNFILSEKQVKSNIEAKIFGLPYLEIGDTVELETENAKILMTITEIDMNYDGGLLETIKGYELGWDALFPSDTLYPSDDLYPNMPI